WSGDTAPAELRRDPGGLVGGAHQKSGAVAPHQHMGRVYPGVSHRAGGRGGREGILGVASPIMSRKCYCYMGQDTSF
ncbi:unnamed protein product, partial [Urochloa humidicola]